MRNVFNNGIKFAIWALVGIALFLCSSIPSAFAQQATETKTQTVEQAWLKQQLLDQIAVDKAKFVEGLVGRWASFSNDGGKELRNHLMTLSGRIAKAKSSRHT